jgi:hypothetical protein
LRANQGNDEYITPTTVLKGQEYHGDWVIWNFKPASSKLKVDVTSFAFENPEEIIKNSPNLIRKEFISSVDFVVTKETVNS